MKTFLLALAMLSCSLPLRSDTLAVDAQTTFVLPGGSAETFAASYDLTSCPYPCALVSGSMSFVTTGPLGSFALASAYPQIDVFNFTNALGDTIQIDFENLDDDGVTPGEYSYANMDITCPSCGYDIGYIFPQGGGITITDPPDPISTPEPPIAAMFLIGVAIMALAKILVYF